jgi:hypothetical protein
MQGLGVGVQLGEGAVRGSVIVGGRECCFGDAGCATLYD